ncbi:aldehyde dehydrogenase family protein [Rhodanobacter sp. MP7CTX1]|uniref:aldehyde dehydrogenase family protein n=1 Tax=Rhodanobacter sp. MP7CTX1 TaxID=2723084 RepID=UPI0016191FC0|nr:aldehyde dehydrogenase family protein [Rhodanobacter sp. MP7CTX1]MBB6187883.1 acyl-CoA reductase-like NAD-dependent aldehyde dehydrogenase [Rhodanobacter sp. MP7CTX1]
MAQTLQVVQAFDRAVITEVPADDARALEAKLAAANRMLRDRDAWLKPHQRSAILLRAVDLLEARQTHFAQLIAREGGKPYADAAVEVTRAIDGLRNAADELRSFAGREIPMGLTAASDGRWAFTTKEPIGIVAAISAFNHPLNLIVHQVAPAIAVGCPVIVKPATATPLSCIDFVALLREAGLDEPWCQTFVTDDNSLAERLATDPRVAFLSFIGSAKVGWYLRSKLPPGTRCALEHGGAAPVIVDRSAPLDRIIEPIVKGGYYHAGQVCVSTQRIFVHADVVEDFVERLGARVRSLRVGDPLLQETEVGPLITPHEATRVTSWIDEAVSAGTVIIGGGRLSETTLIPAVLVEPAADAKVSLLEVFGPVTCVYGYRDLDKAIDIANSLPFAFQASVFSADIAPAMRAARRLDASTVLVNDHTAFRTDWMPFAGRRQSGYGVGGIPYSMEEMSQDKMVVLRYDG